MSYKKTQAIQRNHENSTVKKKMRDIKKKEITKKGKMVIMKPCASLMVVIK